MPDMASENVNNDPRRSPLHYLAQLVLEVHDSLTFTILEIGALPLEGRSEPFHDLLSAFPGSTVYAFEIDERLCEELNRKAKPGLKYCCAALGVKDETRLLYETAHPMCSSLYEPNEELISHYNRMEVAQLKSIGSVDTVSLDSFVRSNGIANVDFIKIDVQGAELDVFRGGVEALSQTVAIVTEVEFVPHYIGQPLFGDVCKFLTDRHFMFHRFLGFGGRALKPIIVNNDPNFATQHIWADAIFLREFLQSLELADDALLKLGVLAFLYASPDVAFYCFRKFDERNHSKLSEKLFS